jgi:hypothetical protein
LFHQGFNVAINAPLEPAHYYHQAAAAAALAKVGRLTSTARYAVAAQQACLTLLSSTKTDAADAQIRYTMFPEMSVNRLGSAGLLLRAVHELASPAEIRLVEAEGLANYVRTAQQPDGSFQQQSGSIQAVAHEAGAASMMARCNESIAVEGLAWSLSHRPAPWKLEVLNKAAGYYSQHVKDLPLTALPSLISGFSEAALRSKDEGCVAAVFNMADAVCNAQIQPERGRMAWVGGFPTASPGKGTMHAPEAQSARFVACLCDAYRVARRQGDAARTEKYRLTAEKGVQFVASLQYTQATAEHFAEHFQPRVVGSFRSGPGEGLLRLQDTAECTVAVATYLTDVAGLTLAPSQAVPAIPKVGR